MTIKPAIIKIEIIQGAELEEQWTLMDGETPFDLDGYVGEAHFREDIDSVETVLELSTTDSTIVLGGIAGTVQLLVPGATTATVKGTSGVWDMKLTKAGKPHRFFKGTWTNDRQVTRD